MKAVTVLVLALAVVLVHCELQQDLLNQTDEDLFFPESLLVDPDKNTDSSDEYSSLEAPKGDGKSGLEGSKEKDVDKVVKPKSTNRLISIYDLANAVVIPNRSPKSNIDHSYFHSSESISDEGDSSGTSEEEDDDDSEEGSTKYEGSGRPHFIWDTDGSGDDYGSGEVDDSGEIDGSGDYYVGQEDDGDRIDLLADADLEEYIPIKNGNLSTDIDSQIDVEYDEEDDEEDEEDDVSMYSPPNNNVVIHGYKGSPIGEMAKIDFLENEMHQVKGQISQLSARMEQQTNDISHLQRIIMQLQEQITALIYRQHHLRD